MKSVLRLQKKGIMMIFFLISISFLGSIVHSAFSTLGIQIDNADTIVEIILVSSESLISVTTDVLPRILVEYSDSLSSQNLTYSLQLIQETSNVPSRIIVEYADSISAQNLTQSSEVITIAGEVSPRIIVEYADSISAQNLTQSSEVITIAGEVSPRIIVEYADSIFQASITPPSLGRAYARELALVEGWNLIGLPLTPEDPSILAVLADILDSVISVWAFDGETKTWSSYSPGAPSDLTTILDGKGYWIKMNTDATLTVRGESANTSELTLFEGWNLIGLPLTPEDPSIEVVLANIVDDVNSVWAFDGETMTWSSYSPGAPSNLVEMVDDRGYWIRMTTDVVWRTRVTIENVPYIHQTYDTAEDFDGRWACGAASTVMVTAYYGKLDIHPITCPNPVTHTNDYSYYVSNEYTNNYGYTYSRVAPSENGVYAPGAFGYIHYPDGAASGSNAVDYLNQHDLDAWVIISPTESQVKAELNAGFPVIASTKLTTLGHWVVIKGYTDDGYYVVNDPWGNYPYDDHEIAGWGEHEGADVLYTWSEMKVDEKYAVFTQPKSDIEQNPPTVDDFSVYNSSVTLGNGFSIYYTVSDTGGSGLNRVEYWRRYEENEWNKTDEVSLVDEGNGPYEGHYTDTPDQVGTYWYGIHVADNAGNWNDEQNSHTDGLPGDFGPVEVTVALARAPQITGLGQFKADGTTAIPEDGSTSESTVVFKGTVSDPDGDAVKLEIELREAVQPFTGMPTSETISELFSSGSRVTVTRYGLVSGDYHWQARAVDESGLASEWVEFGTIGNTDFIVSIPDIGYAVIVAGDDDSVFNTEGISSNANTAYRALRALGFGDERIFYLNGDRPQDIDGDGDDEVDGISSFSEFQDVMEHWVPARVGEYSPFVLYLVGHGTRETFFFSDTEGIGPSFLDYLLGELPSGTQMLIVIDSCYSGSFITDPGGDISAPNRVIVTSAGDDSLSDTLLFVGSLFSQEFWERIGQEQNVKDAFVGATDDANLIGALAGMFWDPWLDDNGDAVGHSPLFLGDDGYFAATMIIGALGARD